MIKINYETALRLANGEIVKEGPDHVYERINGECYNVVPEGPGKWCGSCLVGRIIIEAGISAQSIHDAGADFTAVNEIDSLIPVTFTSKAVIFLAAVQSKQDLGWTWSEAVTEAAELVADMEGN